MTPQEFKAWFEGFTEAMDHTPTKAQWTRIKKRVAEIDGRPITERVFVDRYWHYSQPWYYPLNAFNTFNTSNLGGLGSASNIYSHPSVLNTIPANYDSTSAMYALGKTDALAIGAT